MSYWSRGAVMRKRGAAVVYDVWLRDAASVLHYSGASPEEIYDPGSAVGPDGTIVGKVAGNVLSPVGTPDYAQALTGGAGGPRGAGFTVASTDGFYAAANTVNDYNSVSFAVLTIILPSGLSATYRDVLGKRLSGAPYTGWGVSLRSDYVRVTWDAGATSRDLSLAGAYESVLRYVFHWSDATNTTVGIYTNGATTSVSEYYNTTSTATFALGSYFQTAMGGMCGPTVFWSAANAEAVIANCDVWLPAWAAATGAF